MTDLTMPQTRYAYSGDVAIAYQVAGEGPVDIIIVPGLFSHVEFLHDMPGYTTFLRRLQNFARVVTFDKRGQGLSDRIAGAPSLEQRVDDLRSVLDSVGSERAALFAFSEGCPMSILFAATHPERVSRLILFGGFASGAERMPDDTWLVHSEELMRNWGSGETMKALGPSQLANPDARTQFAKFERLSSSPGALRTLLSLHRQIDVSSILPSLRIPTQVMHRRTDLQVPVTAGRRLAENIPGAKYIEYPDGDHYFWIGETEALLGDIEEFVTGHRDSVAEVERALSTVLFTDLVDSTRNAAAMGDRRWRQVLDSHDQLAQQMIDRHRGKLIKSTGDGVLAIFDGPGRAVRCALRFCSAVQQVGLPVRAGVHTGEIEIRGADIGGIAVHTAARVMSKSDANEVLVSRVVTDLVAGAGLTFKERGSHELKGLPGRWELFSASIS